MLRLVRKRGVILRSRQQILEERKYLVEVLANLEPPQWQLKTLCARWTIEDLAAHLIVRERGGALARTGIFVPRFHRRHASAMAGVKGLGHEKMIAQLERPPAWVGLFPPNIIEFFVHNEDLIRGELQRRRALSDELEDVLSSYIEVLSGLAFRRVAGAFELIVHDKNSRSEIWKTVGRGPKQNIELEITGRPGELVLLFMGRGRHADVEVSGDAEARKFYELADVGI